MIGKKRTCHLLIASLLAFGAAATERTWTYADYDQLTVPEKIRVIEAIANQDAEVYPPALAKRIREYFVKPAPGKTVPVGAAEAFVIAREAAKTHDPESFTIQNVVGNWIIKKFGAPPRPSAPHVPSGH